MIAPAVDQVAEHLSVRRACELLGRSTATHYRRKQSPLLGPVRPRPTPPNALTETERAEVLAVLTSERFCDKSRRPHLGGTARRRLLPVFAIEHAPNPA